MNKSCHITSKIFIKRWALFYRLERIKSKGSNKNVNVSITIPVYHAEKTLPSLVASRLKENRINVELNIVNDRSTGQTISVINRIRDDRIILVELANKGVYAARNLTLTMHRGDWIIFVMMMKSLTILSATESIFPARATTILPYSMVTASG